MADYGKEKSKLAADPVKSAAFRGSAASGSNEGAIAE